jgi:hypothetical protein
MLYGSKLRAWTARECPVRTCNFSKVAAFQIMMLASEDPEARRGGASGSYTGNASTALTKSAWPVRVPVERMMGLLLAGFGDLCRGQAYMFLSQEPAKRVVCVLDTEMVRLVSGPATAVATGI